MTVRITGTQFGYIVPEIKDALDTALAGTLNLQQWQIRHASQPKGHWQDGFLDGLLVITPRVVIIPFTGQIRGGRSMSEKNTRARLLLKATLGI